MYGMNDENYYHEYVELKEVVKEQNDLIKELVSEVSNPELLKKIFAIMNVLSDRMKNI